METGKGSKTAQGNSKAAASKRTTKSPEKSEETKDNSVVIGYSSDSDSTKSGSGTAPDLGDELRRVAAKYEETDYRHWIPIVIADRVSQIEALLEEYAPDNELLDAVVEFGRTTDWTSGKKAILRKAGSTIGAASLNAIVSAIAKKMNDQDDNDE